MGCQQKRTWAGQVGEIGIKGKRRSTGVQFVVSLDVSIDPFQTWRIRQLSSIKVIECGCRISKWQMWKNFSLAQSIGLMDWCYFEKFDLNIPQEETSFWPVLKKNIGNFYFQSRPTGTIYSAWAWTDWLSWKNRAGQPMTKRSTTAK